MEIASFAHRGTGAYWTHRVQHVSTCPRPSSNQTNIWALRMGSGHKVSLLTKKVFAINTWRRRENQFSSMEWHWIINNTPGQAPMLRNHWLVQDGLHFFFFFFQFYLCLYVPFVCLFWFVFEYFLGVICLVFVFFFSNIGFHLSKSPGCFGTHSVDQASFKPAEIQLPLFAKCWA